MSHFLETALLLGAITAAGQRVGQERLPDHLVQKLDQAVRFYQTGQLSDALQLAQAILKSITPEQLTLAERRLRNEHNVLLSLPDLAARARVELVLEGSAHKLARPGPMELPAALMALDTRLNELLDPLKTQLETPLPAVIPDELAEREAVASAGLLTQLEQVNSLLSHLQQLSTQAPAPQRKKLEGRAQQAAGRDFKDDKKNLDDLRDRLVARLVELNLVRLDGAMILAVADNTSFDKRMLAVNRALNSLVALSAHWEPYKKWKLKNGGLDSKVETTWKSQEQQLKTSAAHLLTKVQHFNEATQWWLRGRYGYGAMGGGLAKVVPTGLRNNQTIEALAYSTLLMPQPIPKPQDPLRMPVAYPVPRRHLLLWQIETREKLLVRPPNSLPVRTSEGTAGHSLVNTTGSASSQGPPRLEWVETKPDEVRLAQFVGYLEYTAALWHFERLLKLSTPAERQAIDEMIASDERFVIHSNLSSTFDRTYSQSTLRVPPRAPDARAAQPHERRGLSWVMALARIELGAMRAAFTGESASMNRRAETARKTGNSSLMADDRGPFDKWPPSQIEREPFLEILLDGCRQHYFDLRSVLGKEEVGNAPPVLFERDLLMLERRLAMTYEMVDALGRYAGNALTPSQKRELAQWLSWLATQEGIVRGKLDPRAADAFLPRVERPKLPAVPAAAKQ